MTTILKTRSGLLRRALALTAALSIFVSAPSAATDREPPRDRGVRVAGPADETLRWSDPETWGGALPGAGDEVTIPADRSVLLDVSPPALAGLQINGSLVFARRNLKLTAGWIMVHGSLRVGTVKRPFRHKATITLTGRDEDVMGVGTRAIGVMGGTLDLYGAPGRDGWVRLAATANPGDKRLELSGAPGWKRGDRIVLASTDYWWDHSEEAVVQKASGGSVTLDEPLALQHWGTKQRYGGRAVDERAEVGLLSRNIVIQGAEDANTDGFGAQVIVMEGGRARIVGVEMRRVGQLGILRRYPLHFHMLGNAQSSYLKRSVIHNSFNRCLVVHGTDQLRVTGNVCYDHIGHGYFLEDGAETDNEFAGNLGLGTRVPENPLLPSDTRPATFWITNPDNVLKGNVAAGSEGFGFWYALPEHPTGLSTNENIWPRRTPLKKFAGNVAHSNGSDGLFVDHGPRPDGTTETTYYRAHANPADPESEEIVVRFKNFTAYKNRDRAIWLRGENHIVSKAVLADNRAGATFASAETFLRDSLVVGETRNKGNVKEWEETGVDGRGLPFFWQPDVPIVGLEFYDGRVGAQNVTFAHFRPNDQRESGGLGYLEPDAFSIDPKNFAEKVRFIDSTKVHLAAPEPGYDGDASKVFVDRDGSITGRAGSAVVVDNPFLLDGSCTRRDAWNAHVCDTEYVTLVAGTLDDQPAAIKPLVLRRGDGVTQTLMGCCDDSTSATTSALPGRVYDMEFNEGTPEGVRLVMWRGRGEWVRLTLQRAPGFQVTRYGHALDDVSGIDALDAASTSVYYYDDATSLLHLKIATPDVAYEEIRITPNS